jgi:hypothetical protein
MITPETQAVDKIFAAAEDRDDDVRWAVGVALIGGVLLQADELSRQRLLRGIERELRQVLEGISSLMRGSQQPYPEPPSKRVH